MASLFPALPRNAGAPPIIQFKAGKCKLTQGSNNKFLVTSEAKKGTISLTRGADGVLHFRWIDRTSNAVIDDHIVLPKEAVFERVNTGVESDRVYILKWINPATVHTAAGRRAMYWLQQKDTSADEANVKKVNDELAKERSRETNDVMERLAGMFGMPNPNGRAANAVDPFAAGAFGGSAAAPAPAAPANSTMALDFGDLLSLNPPAAAPAAGSGAGGAAAAPAAAAPVARAAPTSLSSVLSSDVIRQSGVFNDPAVRQQLLLHLPESQRGSGDSGSETAALMDTVQSPQFAQALDALAGALNSDNFNSILSSFQIDPSPGMSKLMMGDAVGAFVDCIKAEAAKNAAAEAAATTSTSSAMDTSEGGGESKQA